jgi:pimeloyl-ACP methyl ester carboxylesterase
MTGRPGFGKNLVRWVGRAAAATCALGVLLSLAGAAYEVVGRHQDARRFPRQGKSVRVGALDLNLDCRGAGSPTVILDSGLGVPAVGWTKVQAPLSRFTRVCSYDRAGYGWSGPATEPRTSLQIARELKALLDAAGEKGPYVLVGHSFGGFNIRVFAGLYPGEVAGIVLVDSSHEDQDQRMESVLPPAVRDQQKQQDARDEELEQLLSPLMTHLGIQRLLMAAGWADVPNYLSKDFVEEILYLNGQSKARDAMVSEARLFPESAAQVRRAGTLGDRPLIVLTAGKPDDEPDPILSTKMKEDQRHV